MTTFSVSLICILLKVFESFLIISWLLPFSHIQANISALILSCAYAGNDATVMLYHEMNLPTLMLRKCRIHFYSLDNHFKSDKFIYIYIYIYIFISQFIYYWNKTYFNYFINRVSRFNDNLVRSHYIDEERCLVLSKLSIKL